MFGVSGNLPAQLPRTGFCFHCNQVTELGFRSNGKPAKLCHECLMIDKARRESSGAAALLQQRDAENRALKTQLATAEAEVKELRGVLAALKSSLELYC